MCVVVRTGCQGGDEVLHPDVDRSRPKKRTTYLQSASGLLPRLYQLSEAVGLAGTKTKAGLMANIPVTVLQGKAAPDRC